jgi:hypothetical protein
VAGVRAMIVSALLVILLPLLKAYGMGAYNLAVVSWLVGVNAGIDVCRYHMKRQRKSLGAAMDSVERAAVKMALALQEASGGYSIEVYEDKQHGGFMLRHPELDGCTAEGDTMEEALSKLGARRPSPRDRRRQRLATLMRRSTTSYGFVNWPTCDAPGMEATAGYYDTHEGGTECWLVVPKPDYVRASGYKDPRPMSVRGVCITGFEIGVIEWDSVTTEWFADLLGPLISLNTGMERVKWATPRAFLDAAVCIGATGMSPWDCTNQHYWQARRGDLTPEGERLYQLVGELYIGRGPELVMVLDT